LIFPTVQSYRAIIQALNNQTCSGSLGEAATTFREEPGVPFIACAESSAEHALRKRNARLGDINIVLMVEHGKAPSPELIERANGIRRQWIEYWETITGHRASMTTKPR
jgi:hypothetical protein